MDFLNEDGMNEWTPISEDFQQLNVESPADPDNVSPGRSSVTAWEEGMESEGGFHRSPFQPLTVAIENITARDDNFGFQHDDFTPTVPKISIFNDSFPPTYNLEIDALDVTLFPDLFRDVNDMSPPLPAIDDHDSSALRDSEHSFNPFIIESQRVSGVRVPLDHVFPSSMFSIARTEARKEVSPHSLTGTFDPLTNVITGLDPVTFGDRKSVV